MDMQTKDLEKQLIKRLEAIKPKITKTSYWEIERDIAEGALAHADYALEILEARYAEDL
jgi:hypothetical protein